MCRPTALVDLEGVLFPEMWPVIATQSGVPELAITTREVPDYQALMSRRLALLQANSLKLSDICAMVSDLEPLEGAVDFIATMSAAFDVVIVTDSFDPMNAAALTCLGVQKVLTNRFETDRDGYINACHYWHHGKGKTEAFKTLRPASKTVAVGDGFNDLEMLNTADCGILYCPSDITQQAAGDLIVKHELGSVSAVFRGLSKDNGWGACSFAQERKCGDLARRMM